MGRAVTSAWMLSALLAAGPAGARADEAVAVIYGRPGTPAEVAKHQVRWEAEKTLVKDVLRLAPGFPKVLTHAQVSELEPGSSALVLGVCSSDEAENLAQLLEAHGAVLVTRTTRVAPERPACAERLSGASTKVRQYIQRDMRELNVVVVERKGASGRLQHLLHMMVRDRTSVASNWDAVTDHQEQVFPPGCTLQLSTDGAAVRVDKRCPGATPAEETLRYSISGGKIVKAEGLESMADVQAVIGGGGTTEAEARVALERWKGVLQHAEAIVGVAPGYPKIARSDDFPGLKPGFQIVLIGVCPADRLAQPMKLLPVLQPGTYAKAVKVTGDPACPSAGLDVPLVKQSRTKERGLLAFGYSAGRPDPDELLVILEDGKGNAIDSAQYDGLMKGCILKYLDADPDAVRASFECPHAREAGAVYSDLDLTYEVRGGKLKVREEESAPR